MRRDRPGPQKLRELSRAVVDYVRTHKVDDFCTNEGLDIFLEASSSDWGDNVVVHVTNKLSTSVKNGTSIHFHGIRQNYTNPSNGVVSITQCPTAQKSTITYKWRVIQYCSTWYHSRIGLQAWRGVFGTIKINGPASANYNEDKGFVVLNDWDIITVDELFDSAQTRGPPALDNGLINKMNVPGTVGYANQTGSRWNTPFTEGTSYRFRLVNAAIDTHFKFMIDNHTMTVIASDLVPIEPYNTTVLDIAMGQPYDIIVRADKASVAKDFWLRAIPQEACSENQSVNSIKRIVYYGPSPSRPTTSPYSYTDACNDEDMSNLVPIVNPYTITSNLLYNKPEPHSMHVTWEDPTLLEIYRNHTSFTNTSGVVQLPRTDEWAFVIIEATLSVPHPIHLHGHDFVVLSQGSGTYTAGDITTINPPRRDTAKLSANGHLVIGFVTDKPGVWLMHCHSGWHTEEGFAMQVVEQYS
ncbi:multicopper oxidase [Aspergillus alliaceus]|uniref:multicopper oxidase n=1 Tax=Petromyces alliaceus TaxID=209559 RepID=UPI0012A47903|nr:Cupredoxin [Aspergillus alliaceus]KAB8233985.1 Cupredoxin [Aspergillus alliaceus]